MVDHEATTAMQEENMWPAQKSQTRQEEHNEFPARESRLLNWEQAASVSGMVRCRVISSQKRHICGSWQTRTTLVSNLWPVTAPETVVKPQNAIHAYSTSSSKLSTKWTSLPYLTHAAITYLMMRRCG